MKDETLLPCPFCGATQDGIEFAETSSGEFCVCCDECSSTGPVRVSKELAIESWNRRALQSGNSGQLNHANSFTDDDLESMAHGDNPVANAYRELLEFRRKAAGGNSSQPVMTSSKLESGENCWSCGKYFTYTQHSECDGYCPHCDSPVDLDDQEEQTLKLVPVEPTEEMISNAWREAVGKCDHETIKRIYAAMLTAAPKSPGDQLTPAPEDRLQKAIFNACIVFLYGCGNGYKNHEGHFYDVETEHSFCIWEIAEQIGVVKETGNYKWSLCKEMEDDIEEVYRKYAMRIMEAAPKVKP